MSDTLPEANASESQTPSASQPTPPVDSTKGDKGSALWREIKGLIGVLVAVLAFHSLVAKPFYIPSESMMPGLMTGDRLVVSKYPFGWSWVSPSFHVLPPMSGRLFGHMPQRGDIVIVTPPHQRSDYIKRVIGLPGDTLRMVDGQLYINGQPIKRVMETPHMVPIDVNSPCGSPTDTAFYQFRVQGPDGKMYCRLPVVRETLPNGRTYETVVLGHSSEDNFAPVTIPPDHVWLMGDNRDDSADSRIPEWQGGLGGPVPWENLGGRAEFITFSLNGTTQWWNPISWIEALRPGRAGRSLRNS